MKNNIIQEVSVSLILIVLLALLLNPFDLWMPSALFMMIVLGLAVVFAVFVSFVWKENTRDEREMLHKMLAGRIAYLVGAGMLVLGIIVQSFSHEIDPWLVLTFGVMILAKIAGIIYGRIKH